MIEGKELVDREESRRLNKDHDVAGKDGLKRRDGEHLSFLRLL